MPGKRAKEALRPVGTLDFIDSIVPMGREKKINRFFPGDKSPG
jgi:hypothetical protein